MTTAKVFNALNPVKASRKAQGRVFKSISLDRGSEIGIVGKGSRR